MDIATMNPFTQNSETGEYDFAHNVTISTQISYNQETGEPERKESFDFKRRSTFVIPRNLLKRKATALENPKAKTCREEIFDHCNMAFQTDFNGFSKTSVFCSLMFLIIPTLFCFSRMAVLIIMSFERILHYFAHRMNEKMGAEGRMNPRSNRRVFYKSPLHIISSQFCKTCRINNELNQIHRIHKGYHQHFYKDFKQMAKNFA